MKGQKWIIISFISIIFTIALTFATLELPRIINGILRSHFPDIYWEPDSIEALLIYARPIGYTCLIAIIGLIVVGFITKRGYLSSFGSFTFFIPAFGYFAFSMFFLSGIGILRVMWLPFWDSSSTLLKLGDVAYIPYWIVKYPFTFLGNTTTLKVSNLIAYFIIAIGLLIFCIGTVTWLHGKFEKRKVFDFGIYKYSRHPQYLGFILWSYGIMILTMLVPVPRGGYQPEPSFPWLLSSLIIICVALNEERVMIDQSDTQYKKYRKNTPFMIPLPRFLSILLMAPYRLIIKKDFPQNGLEILYTFVIYLTLLIASSLLVLLLNAKI